LWNSPQDAGDVGGGELAENDALLVARVEEQRRQKESLKAKFAIRRKVKWTNSGYS
jgi:hypothetical protein